MSSNRSSSSAWTTGIIAGAVGVIGALALLALLRGRQSSEHVDPSEAVDRRITEMERTLLRIQKAMGDSIEK